VDAEQIVDQARLAADAPPADQANAYERALSDLEALLAKAAPG
jgi:hypothetical protein